MKIVELHLVFLDTHQKCIHIKSMLTFTMPTDFPTDKIFTSETYNLDEIHNM